MISHEHQEEVDQDHQDKNTKSSWCALGWLPQELFLFLSYYLLDDGKNKAFQFNSDWRNLMNSNKEYFGELKRQTRYISLINNSNQFLIDPLFRQRILSLVGNPSWQVSCSFQDCVGEVGELHDVTVLCNLNRIYIFKGMARSLSLITNVERVEYRSNDYLSAFNCFAKVKKELSICIVYHGEDESKVPTYDLSCLSPTLEKLCVFVRRVANYHLLPNLRDVEFCGCDSITDVSCFQNAEIARFTCCRNVTNVNSLANVKELVLVGCDGVTDVSQLGRVGKLEISCCRNLHDISGLSTVHTLTVSRFSVTLLSQLNRNTVLNLSGFPAELTSVQFLSGNKLLRMVDISNNNAVQDISVLNTVEILSIRRCFLIKSLTGLTALKELNMIGVEEIESGFEVFQQLRKLSIGNLKHKEQIVHALEEAPFLSSLTLVDSNLPINAFVQLEELTLECCDKITEFPSTLIRLKSLKTANCGNLVSFPDFLPSLQFLVIDGCNKLSLLKIFGDPNVHPLNNVKILQCGELNEIQITRRIILLEIRRCQKLNAISGRDFIGSLKV
jgi:hypothetical protein